MDLIERKTSIPEQTLSFCRYLRTRGYIIGPDEEALALSALAHTSSFGSEEVFMHCLRSVLAKNRRQLEDFRGHYIQYFRELGRAVDSKISEEDGKKHSSEDDKIPGSAPSTEALKSWLYGQETQEEKELAFYSTHRVLNDSDFAAINPDEVDQLMKIVRLIGKKLSLKLKRRYKIHHKGSLDLRQSLRANLRSGGEMIDLRWKIRKKEKTRILVICDVSKSMELYSRFFLHFIYSFQRAFKEVESFVFSTDLYRLTHVMKEDDPIILTRELKNAAPGWSGGTRIGHSLKQLIDHYARYYSGRKTTLLLLTDGWDSGELNQLQDCMMTFRKKLNKIIWINPLAGHPEYETKTAGGQVISQYVDLMVSGHNAESLTALGKLL